MSAADWDESTRTVRQRLFIEALPPNLNIPKDWTVNPQNDLKQRLIGPSMDEKR